MRAGVYRSCAGVKLKLAWPSDTAIIVPVEPSAIAASPVVFTVPPSTLRILIADGVGPPLLARRISERRTVDDVSSTIPWMGLSPPESGAALSTAVMSSVASPTAEELL